MSEPLNDSRGGSIDSIYDELSFDGDETPQGDVIPLEDKKEDELSEEEREEETAKRTKKEKIKEGTDEEDEDESDEESDEELDELEEELEEPSPEKLQLMTPVRRAEIIKKYPNLFKEFPYLEVAYYREQQFTQIHPTIEDAKQSAENSETLMRFEQDLMKGDNTNILQAIKEEDENSFLQLVDNYLPNLAKVDQGAFQHVVGNVVKNTIYAMVKEARSTDNKALESAATILNQFVFASSKFEPPRQLFDPSKMKNGDEGVNKERQEFFQERFETAKSDLGSTVTRILKATIDANIDPKGTMSAYVKRTASKEALETAQKLLQSDARFNSILGKLWQQVFKNGFKSADIKKVEAAYRSKSKTLLPTAIKKARSEALKGTSRKVRTDDVDSDENEEKEETTSRRDRQSGARKTRQNDQESMRGKSTFDLLGD